GTGGSNDHQAVGTTNAYRFTAVPCDWRSGIDGAHRKGRDRGGPVVSSVAQAQHAGLTAADASPAYLSAEQLADLVQVSPKTITRWSLQDASMPVFRRGRVVRFPRESVLAWLRRQESRLSRRTAHDQRKPVANV